MSDEVAEHRSVKIARQRLDHARDTSMQMHWRIGADHAKAFRFRRHGRCVRKAVIRLLEIALLERSRAIAKTAMEDGSVFSAAMRVLWKRGAPCPRTPDRCGSAISATCGSARTRYSVSATAWNRHPGHAAELERKNARENREASLLARVAGATLPSIRANARASAPSASATGVASSSNAPPVLSHTATSRTACIAAVNMTGNNQCHSGWQRAARILRQNLWRGMMADHFNSSTSPRKTNHGETNSRFHCAKRNIQNIGDLDMRPVLEE